MTVLFIGDPLQALNPNKDTTLAMMAVAKSVYYAEPSQLFLRQDRLYVSARSITCAPLSLDPVSFTEGDPEVLPADDFQAIFVRLEPPVDARYLHMTQMLQQVTTKVSNHPRALQGLNEKLSIHAFPQWISPTLVASDPALLMDFISEHQKVVLKPIDGFSGQQIYQFSQGDSNIPVAIEHLTAEGQRPIIAQRYVQQVDQGDKRIFIIGRTVYPHAILRVPPQGQHRGNIARGGHAEVVALSEHEQLIAQTVADTLHEQGVDFAGIDCIGGYLTEINITCPTCVRMLPLEHQYTLIERYLKHVLGCASSPNHCTIANKSA